MGARYTDNDRMLKMAGIDPKTGLPSRMIEGNDYKQYIKDLMIEIDRQDFINRGTWYNLPDGITSDLLERMLYYRGQVMMFYVKETETIYILPYTLDGNINVYGRYEYVRPVQFNGTVKDKDKLFIPGLKRKVLYDIADWTIDSYEDDCIILSDRSYGLSEYCRPRYELNQGIIDMMSEAIPMARTSLISHSGIKGLRVSNEDDSAQVKASNRAITKASLNGEPWVPIIGLNEFQDLTDNGVMKTEEYLSYFQALDNLRMKTLGIESGGVFEKKSHMLQDEMAMNSQKSSRVMDDSVKRRQDFCSMANLIWGLNMWYEPSEQSETLMMNGMMNNEEGVSGEESKEVDNNE